MARASSSSSGSTTSTSFNGWPDFTTPSMRYKSKTLVVNELHEGLFTIDGAFNREQCRGIIDACKGKLVATNPGNRPPRRGEAFRNNERLLVRDEALAQVGIPVGHDDTLIASTETLVYYYYYYYYNNNNYNYNNYTNNNSSSNPSSSQAVHVGVPSALTIHYHPV